MPSVVIPAYNEGAGIERCLRSVLSQGVADLTVVVVANACRDDTAARARAVPVPAGATVLVLDIPEGGKTNALNTGERALREAGRDSFPRLFLDGDIELGPNALAPVFAAAAVPTPIVVSAEAEFETSGCSVPVKLFYAAERFNPYHFESAPNGSGTYGVNAAGRARWGEFPAVIADDGFVERQFAASERRTVRAAPRVYALVRVPRTLAGLRGISARKRVGNDELDRIAPLRPAQRAAGGTFGAVVGGR
ncbi:MAG: glycosyltransferase, partial [Phycisphaerales bacterium]